MFSTENAWLGYWRLINKIYCIIIYYYRTLHCSILQGAVAIWKVSEQFLCKLYGCPGKEAHGNIDICCLEKSTDKLPPTRDALSLHLKRCDYQTKQWLETCNTSSLPRILSHLVVGKKSIMCYRQCGCLKKQYPILVRNLLYVHAKPNVHQKDVPAIRPVKCAFMNVDAMQRTVQIQMAIQNVIIEFRLIKTHVQCVWRFRQSYLYKTGILHNDIF